MRAFLIFNDQSGDRSPTSGHTDEIRRHLPSWQIETALVTPERPADQLARQALSKGFEAILVAGGDGTVSQAAAVLVHQSAVLGVLPLGTYNNIARSLEIPPDLPAACAVIGQRLATRIDVGQIDQRGYFFEAAGVGLDAALFPLGEEVKGGRWWRVYRFFRLTRRYSAKIFNLTLDDRTVTVRALFVAVANGPFYGSNFAVAPTARLNDGKLTIAIYGNFTKYQLLRHFWSISRGQKKYTSRVRILTSSTLRISNAESLPLHCDGTPFGHTPVSFHAISGALPVFSPLAGRAGFRPLSLPE